MPVCLHVIWGSPFMLKGRTEELQQRAYGLQSLKDYLDL